MLSLEAQFTVLQTGSAESQDRYKQCFPKVRPGVPDTQICVRLPK